MKMKQSETKSAHRTITQDKQKAKEHYHPKTESKGTANLRKLYKNAMKGNMPM